MTAIQVAEHLTRCAPCAIDDLAAALVLVLPAADVDALIDALIDSFEIRRKPSDDGPRFAGVMVAPLVHVPAEAWETEVDG